MRHHYVPQFLLRSWAEGTKDQKVEIFRIDRPDLPSSRRAPEYTAFCDNLYSLDRDAVAGLSKHDIETRLLKNIDNEAARVIQNLNKSGFQNFSRKNAFEWARFLVSLVVRQPDLVQEIRLEATAVLRQELANNPEEYEVLISKEDPPDLTSWTERQFPGLIENAGIPLIAEIINDERHGPAILRMKWYLWDFSSTAFDLMLGDNPCVLINRAGDSQSLVALPIAPRKAFFGVGTESVFSALRRVTQRELATRLNESTVFQARTRVYARNDLPRRFIENRLRRKNSRP